MFYWTNGKRSTQISKMDSTWINNKEMYSLNISKLLHNNNVNCVLLPTLDTNFCACPLYVRIMLSLLWPEFTAETNLHEQTVIGCHMLSSYRVDKCSIMFGQAVPNIKVLHLKHILLALAVEIQHEIQNMYYFSNAPLNNLQLFHNARKCI